MEKKILRNRIALCLCISFCIVFSVFFFFSTPPTTPPDEIAHLAYPRQMLLTGQLPAFLSSQNFWESHQPPLYYVLSLPFVELASHFNFSTQVYVNRLPSLFLFWGALVIFYYLLRRLFVNNIIKQIAGLVLFCVPMVLYVASSFSNDALVLFMSTICLSVLFFVPNKTNTNAILLGLLFGGCLLTKIDLYPLALVTFLAFIFSVPWKQKILITLTTLISSGWWFFHNLMSGSGLFGLKFTFILWNQKSDFSNIVTWLTLGKKLFSGYIGIFGKYTIAFPNWVYLLILIPFVVALYLGVRVWGLKSRNGKISLSIIGLTILFVIVQNFQFFQPQGRYLIAIIPFVVILLISAPITVKIYRGAIYSLCALIVILEPMSIILLHSYYQKNPIASFQHNRSIAIVPGDWNGDRSAVSKNGSELSVHPPAHIFTLKDMRALTSDQPTIHLRISSQQQITYRVYWKILGQTAFSTSRMVERTGVGDQLILIPEPLQTIIQDVKLEFPANQSPFILQTCSMTTS